MSKRESAVGSRSTELAAARQRAVQARSPRLSRKESQAQTRLRLLESAREVVGRVGYENASIDLISENAGYSKGAFYSNFPSKEAIFLKLLEMHASQDVPEIERLLQHASEPRQMIEIISNWAAQRSRDPNWGILALELLRRAKLQHTYTARHAKLFAAQWRGLGRLLLAMFPKGSVPASAEVLGALVMELTYGASSAITNRPGVRKLVQAALTAFYDAYSPKSVR
jgi:AcrR family transcriptional regulator